jgi:Stress responsive A/B Barrel Domain
MSTSRRTFMATAAAAAATVTATQATGAPAVNAYPKLVHHVFFWLKDPSSKDDLAKLLAGLRTLAKIETVRGVHFGVPASTEKRDVVDNSYSASEILFFDDTAGQKVYQDHPIHQQFVADCSHLWTKVVVYDALAV